jgi:tetratricopeptide (TPR) repeat protein
MSWIEKGYSYAVKGQYEKAIESFTKAIEQSPEDERAYYNRGAIYGNLGKYDEALNDFSKTLELNPKYEKAFHSRGVAHLRLGNHKEAILDFKTAAGLGHKPSEEYLKNEPLSSYYEEEREKRKTVSKVKKGRISKAKSKPGQPSKNPDTDTYNTKKMTFYVKEELLDRLYNFAYWDRYSITEALNIALEHGLRDKNTEKRNKK